LAERRARAIGAFSGGLDGIVAARLLAEIGVDVSLATFSSPFFQAGPGRLGAEQLGLPWREIDMTAVLMGILADPPSGFGSNMNPCIDCHAAMLAILGRLLPAEGFDFVFTGEVLGQRPMSQNRHSLVRVARLSGLGDRLLRPLSAKLLEPVLPEREGLVDRSLLLGISGRGRSPQISFARERGLSYPQSGGGCLLTDPGYSRRLRVLMDGELLSPRSARLIRFGRVFALPGGAVGVLGRDEADNNELEALSEGRFLRLRDRPGPSAVLLGDPSAAPVLAGLVAFHAKLPTGSTALVLEGEDAEHAVTVPAPGDVRPLLVCIEEP